jgi:hypothetical protein
LTGHLAALGQDRHPPAISGKRRKRKSLLTPEEREAQQRRTEKLIELIRRAEIELATGKRPPPDPVQT